MSIAITDEHRALAGTASDLLRSRDSRGVARALLDSPTEGMPELWKDYVGQGWLGLHVPEDLGGSGYSLEELVVVVEELGKAMAPGPFVPTVIASALLVAAGDDATKKSLVPGLVDGSKTAGIGFQPKLKLDGGKVSGSAGTVLGGGLADLIIATVGDDVVVVDAKADGVTIETPPNLDPTRRSARVKFDGAAATVIAGAAPTLGDLSRVVLSAEAVGVAREATDLAAAYAKVRLQFGRVIGTYQAVKHHCANMAVATEASTCAVWDAARAAKAGGDQLAYTAAIAATLAGPAAYLCANLNTQVHGGIAMTWEHDAHLYIRRSTVLNQLLDADTAAAEVTAMLKKGVKRVRGIDLPPEAEPIRDEVRSFVASIKDLDSAEQREKLIETGYIQAHWPKPYGREAGALEQLVIEQEFSAAGIRKPSYGITGWVILTLIQHGTPEQVSRWVSGALRQEVIWCQLFSEPDAGSDAAGIKTKATRVDGGWLVSGQKVWTTGAHVAGMGLATVRTDPTKPKHDGITTMVIDMKAEGVEVRPIKMTMGASEFNEVFFNDVLVPDDDVIGPIDGGWTVARATLGNESVSIGGGDGGMSMPGEALLMPYLANPDRLPGGEQKIGRYTATHQAMAVMNLRAAQRAVGGGGPGPEGNITKLVLSEIGHDAAAYLAQLGAADTAFMDGAGGMGNMLVLMHRAMSIAGGTSEIKRNQIGERILGLPRDPLIN